MTKQYDIYCITKANGHEYLHCATIEAGSVKEAKNAMKRTIRENYGRHAFSLGTKPGGDWNWERYCENHGETMESIRRRARRDSGFTIR